MPVGGGPGGDFQGVGQQLGDDGQHSPGGRDKQAFQGDGDVLDRGPPVVSERRGGALDAGDQAPLYPAVELVESRAGFLADPADDFRDDGQEGLPEPGGQVREGGFEDLDLVGEGVSLAAELAVEVPGLLHDERERGGLGGLVGQGSAYFFEAELGRPRLDRGLLEAHPVPLDRVPLALEGRGDGLDGLGGRAAEPGRQVGAQGDEVAGFACELVKARSAVFELRADDGRQLVVLVARQAEVLGGRGGVAVDGFRILLEHVVDGPGGLFEVGCGLDAGGAHRRGGRAGPFGGLFELLSEGGDAVAEAGQPGGVAEGGHLALELAGLGQDRDDDLLLCHVG